MAPKYGKREKTIVKFAAILAIIALLVGTLAPALTVLLEQGA